MGAIVTLTAPHTGRSPNDRFIVRDESTEATVDWGPVNRSVSKAHFGLLRTNVVDYLNGVDLFVQDARAGADETHGINVRVVSESPWQALFSHNMFLRLGPEDLQRFVPGFTVLHAPSLKADPSVHGTQSETAV
ncbi:uncharacterized protein METZ01_LOCUS301483, partial [marine metagenome]